MTLEFPKRFLRCKRGSTAVDFAIVAMPFFLLLMATLEYALVSFASVALEEGMNQAVREVRTGQIQSSGGGVNRFKSLLCDAAGGLIDCNGELYIDVRPFDQVGDPSSLNPLDNGEIVDIFEYSEGEANQFVLTRVFYVWEFNTPLVGHIFGNMTGGKHLLSASAFFRNEPF